MILNGRRVQVRDIWESWQKKYNPSKTEQGTQSTAHAFGTEIGRLINEGKIKEHNFSLTELCEQLNPGMSARTVIESGNIHQSGFPTIAAEVIAAKIIAAYDQYPKQAAALHMTMPSRREEERVPGWTPVGSIKQIKIKEKYPEVQPPEEKIRRITNKKYGGKISLGREDIIFDHTGQLMKRANDIGVEAARVEEETKMKGFIDQNSDMYNGGDLYSAGNGNYISGGSSALGNDSWEEVDTGLMEKQDERGNPIWIPGDRPKLMVPPRLVPTARRLQKQEFKVGATTDNRDINLAQNQFDIVINPYYASLTTTTKWHYGAFIRQFLWTQVWPLETSMRTGKEVDGWSSDIIQEVKASFFGNLGALDIKYVYESAGQ